MSGNKEKTENRKKKDSFPYADILDLPHPEIRSRKRMSMEARAAQFAPFAALTGYGEAIDDTAERTAEAVLAAEAGEPFHELP